MPLDAAKESLLRRCAEERVRSKAANFRLPVEMDLESAICIVGNLQLALRHPQNNGPSAKVARDTIDGIIRRMRESGLTAHAELARLGDDPGYDV